MLRVSWCEDRTGDPTAINGVSFGLFQERREKSSDPMQQVHDAYALWRAQGLQAWNSSRACWG